MELMLEMYDELIYIFLGDSLKVMEVLLLSHESHSKNKHLDRFLYV